MLCTSARAAVTTLPAVDAGSPPPPSAASATAVVVGAAAAGAACAASIAAATFSVPGTFLLPLVPTARRRRLPRAILTSGTLGCLVGSLCAFSSRRAAGRFFFYAARMRLSSNVAARIRFPAGRITVPSSRLLATGSERSGGSNSSSSGGGRKEKRTKMTVVEGNASGADKSPAWNGENIVPALYVVSTPLGNLGDLSARAMSVLASVDWIAAEVRCCRCRFASGSECLFSLFIACECFLLYLSGLGGDSAAAGHADDDESAAQVRRDGKSTPIAASSSFFFGAVVQGQRDDEMRVTD
jgi:hypothetical protein